MTIDGIPPAPSPEFSAGFDAGLRSKQQLASPDLQVLSLANALDTLALHAAGVAGGDGDYHESCLECSATILLARVVRFGDQMRSIERERQARHG